MAFIFLAQGINRLFDGNSDKFFAQGMGFLALFVLPFRQILCSVFYFLLHGIEVVYQLFFFFFGQFVKNVGAQDFAVFDRSNDQADRHMQQRNAFAFGFFLQQADIFFFALLVFFLNDAQSGLVFVAVDQCRQRDGEIFNQLVNILGKLTGF